MTKAYRFNEWSSLIDGTPAQQKPGKIKKGDTVQFSTTEVSVGSSSNRYGDSWDLPLIVKAVIVEIDSRDVKVHFTDRDGLDHDSWLPINRMTKVFGRNHAYTD